MHPTCCISWKIGNLRHMYRAAIVQIVKNVKMQQTKHENASAKCKMWAQKCKNETNEMRNRSAKLRDLHPSNAINYHNRDNIHFRQMQMYSSCSQGNPDHRMPTGLFAVPHYTILTSTNFIHFKADPPLSHHYSTVLPMSEQKKAYRRARTFIYPSLLVDERIILG